MPGRFGNGAATYSFWQGNKRLKKIAFGARRMDSNSQMEKG